MEKIIIHLDFGKGSEHFYWAEYGGVRAYNTAFRAIPGRNLTEAKTNPNGTTTLTESTEHHAERFPEP